MTFPGLSSVLSLMRINTGMTAHWTGQDLALIAVSGYLVDNTASYSIRHLVDPLVTKKTNS